MLISLILTPVVFITCFGMCSLIDVIDRSDRGVEAKVIASSAGVVVFIVLEIVLEIVARC